MLIKNTSGSGQQPNGEDFWVKAEKLLYTAYIALIFCFYPEHERNFRTLIELINASETREDDETFKNAALALKEGEVSDWIISEDFGYFLIKCDSTDPAEFVDDTSFISTILSSGENLSGKIMWESAQELGIQFANEEIESMVKESLGLED